MTGLGNILTGELKFHSSYISDNNKLSNCILQPDYIKQTIICHTLFSINEAAKKYFSSVTSYSKG